MSRYIFIAVLPFVLFSCKTDKEEVTAQKTGYQIEPVDIQHIKITDDFWLPIIKRVQEKTIDYAIAKCEEEGRMDNFLIAGGKMNGTVRGAMPFDDTDLYKIIEGASNSLITAPNDKLETTLDTLIEIIAVGQEEDGYLTTWRTINPAKPPAPWVQVKEPKRWDGLFMSHELYNAGHLYEAAYVHYKATGKRTFLDIALKNADLMVKTFGEGEGKIDAVPGHQIIETGLLKLYQVTGKEEYIDLAKYFLDGRGNPENHELFGPYSQDHVPVVEQDEVVGHSVRAMYMYAAMTDIAVLKKDSAYEAAVDKLWENMVSKKTYITGGIGAKHDGEQFGANYELPNLTAYNETCASIGSVYWNHRLHLKTGKVDYFDVIERTLYNGLISGLSLDGKHFFYPNALEADGKYKFNRGACTRQGWFDCSCCPTNVIRFLPAVAGLLYSKTDNEIYVNLYAGNTATIKLKNNEFQITETTNYPWNGKVELELNPKNNSETTFYLRVPSWARNVVMPGNLYQYTTTSTATSILKINGKAQNATVQNGYFVITKNWKKGDVIELGIPMEVKMVTADEKVEEDRGKVTLEYGPLVYAVEEADNPNIDNIKIQKGEQFTPIMEANLLDGVVTLNKENFKAIPYYAWSNRGIGKMKVWLPFENN